MIRRNVEAADTLVFAQIVQRDVQALGTLYDRYGALLYRLALRITHDDRLAEAAVLLVFQVVWQAVTGGPHAGNVRHWLIALTRQHALGVANLRHPEQAASISTAEGEDYADGAVEPSAVQEALGELPPHQRDIIERAYYGGQTCAAIAAHVGQPMPAVMAELRQAVLALQARICAAKVAP